MNYILLIEGFNNWLETNHLPILSQLLWFKLVHLFNKCAWCEWIQVDNQRLMSMLEIKNKTTFLKIRSLLVEKELILYQKGKKGISPKYKLGTKFIPNSVPNSIPNNVPIGVPLNKLNKTKLNKENISRNTKVLLDIQKKKFLLASERMFC